MPKHKPTKSSQRQRSPKPSTSLQSVVTVDDEDSDISASQNVRKALAGTSKETFMHKTHELVQYLLIMDQKKIPIKRLDINKAVLKELSKAFPAFIEEATKILREVYGIELVETEKSKSYMLINNLEQDCEMQMEWSPKDNCRMALVMVILSVIFMKDNVITDVELYHFLKKLGVDVDVPHETFGDVKKLVCVELVRQGYLEMQRQPASDPPSFEFRWGLRAKCETSKRYVLDFVSQIYDIETPQIWANQYEDMLQDEETTQN